MKTKLSLVAWFPLLFAGALAPQATAVVVVQGIASSNGENVFVELHADISTTPLLSYGVRVLSDPNILQAMNASRDESIWFLGDSGNGIPYPLPNLSDPGAALLLGARLDSANPLQGVQGNNVPLGMVVYGRVATETPAFALAQGRPGLFADFVTTYGAVLDDQPGQIIFGNIAADPADQDLDGLPDSWEKDHFGGTENAFYSDDPDTDRYSNRDEQQLGSDPNETESNFGFEIISEPTDVVLRWTSFAGRTYTVEESSDLVKFSPVKTGIEATPPMNTFELGLTTRPGVAFYRVLLERYAGR